MIITQGDLWAHRHAIKCAPAGPVGRWIWDPALTATRRSARTPEETQLFHDAHGWPHATDASLFAVPHYADRRRLAGLPSAGWSSGQIVQWLVPTNDLGAAARLLAESPWHTPRRLLEVYATTVEWAQVPHAISTLLVRIAPPHLRPGPLWVGLEDLTFANGWTATSALAYVAPHLRHNLWARILTVLAGACRRGAADGVPAPDLQAWEHALVQAIADDTTLLPALVATTPEHPVVLAAIAQLSAALPGGLSVPHLRRAP